MRKVWIIPIVIIVFLGIVAFVPLVREAVIGFAADKGGATWAYLSGVWSGIASTSAYQTYHVLIWFGGALIFAYAIHQLHAKDKLPIWKTKQPQGAAAPMGAPQAVIIREVAVPTRAEPPTSPEKETEKAQEAPAS